MNSSPIVPLIPMPQRVSPIGRFFRSLTVWIVALVLLDGASLARAEGLPKSLVLSDAKWLLHLDLEALKRTELYKYLQQKGQLNEMFDFSMSANDQKLSLDFNRCESLTCYGTSLNFADDGAAAIVKLPSAYRRELLDSMAKIAASEQSTLTAIADKKSWHGYQLEDEVFIYSPKSDTFVFGAEELGEKVAALVAGKSASKPPAFIQSLVAKTTPFLVLAYSGEVNELSEAPVSFHFNLNLPNGGTNAVTNLTDLAQLEVFKKIEGGNMVFGESTNHFWTQLKLKAKSPQDAAQLQQSINAITALITTLPATNTQWRTLVQHLAVTAEGSAVNVRFVHPVSIEGRTIYALLEEGVKSTSAEAMSEPTTNDAKPSPPPPAPAATVRQQP